MPHFIISSILFYTNSIYLLFYPTYIEIIIYFYKLYRIQKILTLCRLVPQGFVRHPGEQNVIEFLDSIYKAYYLLSFFTVIITYIIIAAATAPMKYSIGIYFGSRLFPVISGSFSTFSSIPSF